MGIEIQKSFDFGDELERQLNRTEKNMGVALSDHITTIVQNATSGRDIEGKAFAPYSKGYQKRRAKAGFSTRPNLTVTGNMLQAIDSRVRRVGDKIVGEIFFRGTSSASRLGKGSASAADKARWNQKLRNFFGITTKQASRLLETLRGK